MKTKNLVQAAILLAIGAVLHLVVPGIVNGMKPDFLLVTMFCALIINDDLKSTLIISVVTGLIAAATTSFPGGQIPSIIDKVVSAFTFIFLYRSVFKNMKNKKVATFVNTFINTFISGFIFLFSANQLFGINMPGGISVLILSIVLPTCIFNGIFSLIAERIIFVYQKAALQ